MFKKMHWRIAIPYIILILAGLLALGLYISSFFERIYRQHLEDRLVDETRLIAEQLSDEQELWMDLALLDERVGIWATIIDARVTIVAVDGVVVGE